MRGHGADDKRPVFARNAVQPSDGAEVDQARKPIQTLFEGGNQCLPAGEQLGARHRLQRQIGFVECARAAIVECVHG